MESLDDNYILVLTTNNKERDAVRQVLSEAHSAEVRMRTSGAQIGFLGENFCVHLNGTSGAQSDNSIGRMARKLTQKIMGQTQFPKPKLVVVVGFCWGNPQHTDILDVIVASRISDVNYRKVMSDGTSYRCVERESLLGDLSEILNKTHFAGISVTVKFGRLLSSETFLANDQARDEMLKAHSDALGGEMEGFDLVKDLDVPWVFLKSVSDTAGDPTDREMQADAAKAAAQVLLPTVEALAEEELISEPRKGNSVDRLASTLVGNAITIPRPLGDKYEVLRSMNLQVPRLTHRISVYLEGSIEKDLSVLIVEIAQNAFLHGDASWVSIEFLDDKIVVKDNGQLYNPSLLVGSKGGATAWQAIQMYLNEGGPLRFKAKAAKKNGNVYTITFDEVVRAITRARTDCNITGVDYGYSFPSDVPSDLDKCETLYYSAEKENTYSLRMVTSTRLEAILLADKSLIIACQDSDHARMMQERFINYSSDRVRIIVRRS